MSIKDRVNRLRDAEQQWLENYKRTLEEWNERNKVCLGKNHESCQAKERGKEGGEKS